MLPAGFTSILEAGSRDDFRHEVVRFSQTLGFNTVSAMAVIDFAGGRTRSLPACSRHSVSDGKRLPPIHLAPCPLFFASACVQLRLRCKSAMNFWAARQPMSSSGAQR